MIRFAGLEFTILSKKSLFADFERVVFLVTANAEIIVRANENADYRSIMKKADCTFDGQIPFILAKLMNRKVSFEKISGSDLIYDVSAHAYQKREKVFLLGASEESNTGAVEKLRQRYPGLQVEGYSPPFENYPFSPETSHKIRTLIESYRPDYIFVGFGAIKQERWIYDHLPLLTDLKVKLAVGSGGTFEFVSGKIKRAPVIIQKIGLEGVFRLLMEPKWFRVSRLLKSFKIFFYAIKN